MVDIDWPVEFGTWLDRLETDARAGDERARTVLVFVARALDQLRNLREPPRRESETATLRWVRQGGIRCGACRMPITRRPLSG